MSKKLKETEIDSVTQQVEVGIIIDEEGTIMWPIKESYVEAIRDAQPSFGEKALKATIVYTVE